MTSTLTVPSSVRTSRADWPAVFPCARVRAESQAAAMIATASKGRIRFITPAGDPMMD